MKISDYRRALFTGEGVTSTPRWIGSGKRTIFTLWREIIKSHEGKPAGYCKPYGIRTKGYHAL